MENWWEERSLPEKIVLGVGLGILCLGLVFLFGWIVMLLWNALVPDIFGWKRVSYWQAWGLLVLCTILFKGIGSSGGSGSKSDRKRKEELRRHMRDAASGDACGEALMGDGEGDSRADSGASEGD